MSAFEPFYQKEFYNRIQPEETRVKPHISKRASKLFLETSVAALCMLSLLGNYFSYRYIEKLQHRQEQQILQYDSLVSVKLLLDQELTRLRARLPAYPMEEKPVKILLQNTGDLPQEKITRDDR